VSEKSGVMKENWWTVVLVVVHRVFYSHFIISLKKYDMVTKTFLYIIIILCFVNKLNSSMSNFGGRLSQPKKLNIFWGFLFFCQHNSTGGGFLILKQIIGKLTVNLRNLIKQLRPYLLTKKIINSQIYLINN
jgi:hypothetical protein